MPDGLVAQTLKYVDGKDLVRAGRSSKRLRFLTDDGGDAAGGTPSLAGLVWKALCDGRQWHQPGTRTRGWVRWSRVYYGSVCIECGEPGAVTINETGSPLGFPNARFSLCARCVRSSTQLWRVQYRPEIAGSETKLNHLLFRIATVRRELGYKRQEASPKKKQRRRAS